MGCGPRGGFRSRARTFTPSLNASATGRVVSAGPIAGVIRPRHCRCPLSCIRPGSPCQPNPQHRRGRGNPRFGLEIATRRHTEPPRHTPPALHRDGSTRSSAESGRSRFYLPVFSLWLHPGQQHGRRLPSASSVCVLVIRRCLVSSSLASSTQQIHSLRASGVMSFHAASAGPSSANAFRRSAGTLCTVPLGTVGLPMFRDYRRSSRSGARSQPRLGVDPRAGLLHPATRSPHARSADGVPPAMDDGRGESEVWFSLMR